jgi:hypothetical protein
VATDALSWQGILNIQCFYGQYDMVSLLMILTGVDYSKPHQDAKASKFKDAIKDWHSLDDADYFDWQALILYHDTSTKLESDSWLDNALRLSMDKTLCAEVESDFFNIPHYQQGSITTLRCIMKCMMIKTQEFCDALESYLKTFDKTEFMGKNVHIACLCLKAIAKALGNDDLPTNVICKVLESFSKSSTKSFNKVCASQIALQCGSFYSKIMEATSLHVQLIDLLTDLKNAYLGLIGTNLWEGAGHPGMTQGASFRAVTSETPGEH